MIWLLTAAAVALGVPAMAWLAQDRLVFFPQPVLSTAHLPPGTMPLEIAAADGTRLAGWIVAGGGVASPTVIYFGGNAEEVSWTLAERRWPRDVTLVAVNYRGYGRSEGAPGEPELKADALAIHDAVAARADVDPRRIVVFGRSLGTALAVHVAAARPVAGVVLASPFASLVAVGKAHYPWLPVGLLLRHRFDAVADASRSQSPLLALVGQQDSLIAPEHSRVLYDAWAGSKSWAAIAGADHNSLGASDVYWEQVARFLAQR